MVTFKCTVIGGGPAGLAAVGSCLDAKLSPLLWIDPSFSGGRLNQYLSVPSNTKVAVFERFARTPLSFQKALQASGDAGIAMLQGWDPQSGCPLTLARDSTQAMSRLVIAEHRDLVTSFNGYAHKVVRDGKSSKWTVHCDANDPQLAKHSSCPVRKAFSTERVIFATGSKPRPSIPLHPSLQAVNTLDLDTALNPTRLSKTVKATDRILVIGSSHSAILVLKNLTDLHHPPLDIVNVWKDPLLYAEYMPDDWILYDNTGLKGIAAEWAMHRLESGRVPSIKRISTEELGSEASIQKPFDFVVFAVGFIRNPLPAIHFNELSEALDESKITHDAKTSRLLHAGSVLPNLYGLGIAFPEKTVDPRGNIEDSVGMWKFMKYSQRIVPAVIALKSNL